MSITHVTPNQRMSQATIHNGTAYFAGQVATDPDAGMREQTEQVLGKIDRLLAEVGSNKDHLLSATVWVTDLAEFNEMNAAWDAWVSPGRPPARACVEAKLANPAWKVEIMLTVALPEG